MPRKADIEGVLNQSQLQGCCVLNPFGELHAAKDTRRDTWGAFGHAKNMLNAVDATTVATAKAYLAKGKTLATSMPWAGTCATFACASAYLIQNVATLNTIELFSFGTTAVGHVFLVIDRPPASNAADPNTWGNYLVVDQWYANQVGPATQPAFEGACAYMTWFTAKQNIALVLKVK